MPVLALHRGQFPGGEGVELRLQIHLAAVAADHLGPAHQVAEGVTAALAPGVPHADTLDVVGVGDGDVDALELLAVLPAVHAQGDALDGGELLVHFLADGEAVLPVLTHLCFLLIFVV